MPLTFVNVKFISVYREYSVEIKVQRYSEAFSE